MPQTLLLASNVTTKGDKPAVTFVRGNYLTVTAAMSSTGASPYCSFDIVDETGIILTRGEASGNAEPTVIENLRSSSATFYVRVNTIKDGSFSVSATVSESQLDGSEYSGELVGAGTVGVANGLLQPVTLREFQSLVNVTNAATGGTVTASIDNNSPLGGRALKLDIGAGVTQHDLTISDFSIDNFKRDQGKLVWLVWFSDPRAISQIQAFVGNDSSLTRNYRYDYRLASSGTRMAMGANVIDVKYIGAAVDTLLGTDTAKTARLRIQRSTTASSGLQIIGAGDAPSATPTTMWVKGVYLSDPKTKPFVVLTFDDAHVSWGTYLRQAMKARGLLGTFGVNSGDIGTNPALYIDYPTLDLIYNDGHDVASHNITNTPFSIAGANQYAQDYATTRDIYRNLGYSRMPNYHPFVQGLHNPDAVEMIRAQASTYIRMVRNENHEPLFTDWNHKQFPSLSLGSGTSLAQAQQRVTDAVTMKQDVWVMGHEFAETDSSSVTWAFQKMNDFLDYLVAQRDMGLIGGVGSLSEYIKYRGINPKA